MAKQKKPPSSSTLPLFGEQPGSDIPKPQAPTPQQTSLPEGLAEGEYELDDQDGMPREIVGEWVRDKHARLQRYVHISGTGVRKQWLKHPSSAGATYIELLSGPGKLRVRNEKAAIDGSPLVAWREAQKTDSAFTEVWVADKDENLVSAAKTRLIRAGANVKSEVGFAIDTVDSIVRRLNPHALHFAFLDPFSLGALPFVVIEKLARLKRMDILIHFSTQDLTRNLRRYINDSDSPLDAFAPGWREKIDDFNRSEDHLRGIIFEHWREKIRGIGMDTAEAAELIVGPTRQPLYWLAFAARHPQALKFWEKIRRIQPVTESLLTDRPARQSGPLGDWQSLNMTPLNLYTSNKS